MARKDGALEVRARLEDDPDGGMPPDEVVAYAFAPNGKLLDSKPLKDGVARLKVPIGDSPVPGRVLIGPPVGDDVPLLDELLRRGAWEEHIRLEPKLPRLDVLIPSSDWLCWILSRCTVRGTLLKRTVRNGITVDLPVCNADVEIYEVDPLPILIPRIPDDILDRIKDILVKQPIPIPDPIPDPDPGPILPPPGPGPDPGPFFGMHAEHAAAPAATAELKSAPAPEALRAALSLADSPNAIRQVLLANPIVIRPLICRLFPRFVTKRLLGIAHTDECGHFRFTFFRGCHNPDQPDLYFKATQQWFFGRLTVLEPLPVACHTWWNYQCGTEVTLYATNPLTLTCPPCGPVVAPDNYVMVFGIGRHSAHAIHGASADLSNGAAERGLTSGGEPWAGMLRLRLDFDPGLRDAGVLYYRVSWARAGGTFQPLLDECHRHYRVAVGGGGISYVGYGLGPHVVGSAAGLFEIPPALPPQGNWVVVDPVEDTTNAKFPSHLLVPGVAPSSATDNAGVHELKIELFDSAGNAVDAAALGVNWVVPDVDDLGTPGTINGEAPAAGAVVGNAFILPLHVDNNACEGRLDAPMLDGSAAADACGVMRYPATGGNVEMPYRAAHRNGFATHSFTVQRGAEPPTTPPVTALGGGNFSAASSVAGLRGTCTIAAFAERLHVSATATDGWGRQSWLDAHDVRAFTLAPQP
jgi:hypothetical protein